MQENENFDYAGNCAGPTIYEPMFLPSPKENLLDDSPLPKFIALVVQIYLIAIANSLRKLCLTHDEENHVA